MTDADRCVCCGEIIPEGQWVCKNCKAEGKREQNILVFDIPEGYGRLWMRFRRTEGMLVFGICGRKIKVGRNPEASKDAKRTAPVFGVVCQSAAKARAIAGAFTDLAEEMERRAESE
jgi:hypothetical protein